MLSAVEIEPTRPHTATVVWLHGLGASGHDFEPIAPMLRMPWVRFVFPHAPEREVTINAGYVMPSWYDIRHLRFDSAPSRPPQADGLGREDEAQLAESAAAVRALLAREEARVPAGRIVLAGFSQGAALALHVGRTYPRRLAGILALSGYLVMPKTPDDPANADTPMLLLHGTQDDVVPVRAGRASYDALATPTRPIAWSEYAMAHEVCLDELRDIAMWLRERVPSGG
jgi:phospholipase/carboxylesterase